MSSPAAETTSLRAIRSHLLFSNDYLLNRLPRHPEWKRSAPQRELLGEASKVILSAGELINSGNEAQIRTEVVDPILRIVNPYFLSNQRLATGSEPDYLLFPDAGSKEGKQFALALAVGEAKEPGKNFDRASGERSPVRQLYDYMIDSSTKWGFLTDGRRWRLLSRDRPSDSWLEIDLVDIVARRDEGEWLYFYNLFRREVLLPKPQGPLLQEFLSDSSRFSQQVGEQLNDRVYAALLELADGFLSWQGNRLDRKNPPVLDEVRSASLILLYRLLFILYAESRNLLPLRKEHYRQVSLDQLRAETFGASRGIGEFLPESRRLWNALKDLFRIIDKGSASLAVNPYNGGLFSDENELLSSARNLAQWDIGDNALAKALDLLSTAPSNAIPGSFSNVDYSSLDVRHLGTIYEGLLEYRLCYAEEPLISVRKKGVEIWVPQSKTELVGAESVRKKTQRVNAGTVYLQTEKRLRKATGSYYTPGPVVSAIVRQTLEPIVRKRRSEAKQAGSSESAAVLSVRVLDPAMGSGHFLVEATRVLADELLDAEVADTRSLNRPNLDYDVPRARRDVLRTCIYGVDVNPLAVELAKVSLWLATISSDHPLSFLDHRLRVGNSLVGAKLEEIAWLPGQAPNGLKSMPPGELGLLRKVMDTTQALSHGREVSPDDVRQKATLFSELHRSPEYVRIRTVADAYTGLEIGTDQGKSLPDSIQTHYMDLVNEAYYGDPKKWRQRSGARWVVDAIRIAQSASAFHWSLEFPDVLVIGEEQTSRGFDVIVGNPPWVPFLEIPDKTREYLRQNFQTATKKFDLSLQFLELAIGLARHGGCIGLLLPNKFLAADYGRSTKELLVSSGRLEQIVDFGDYPMFPAATTYPCYIVESKDGEVAHPDSELKLSTLPYGAAKDCDLGSLVDETGGWKQPFVQRTVPISEFMRNPVLDEPSPVYSVPTVSLVEFLPEMGQGIWTGLKGAFVVSREEAVQENIERDLLHPVVDGADVDRYYLHATPDHLLLYPYAIEGGTLRPVDIAKFPGAQGHFLKWREKLEQRRNWNRTITEAGLSFYEIWNPSPILLRPKLVVQDIADENTFALDRSGTVLCMNTCYVLPIYHLPQGVSPELMLALLNSKPMTEQFRSLSTRMQGGFRRYQAHYVQRLQLPASLLTVTRGDTAKLRNMARSLADQTSPLPGSKDWLDLLTAESKGNRVGNICTLLEVLAKKLETLAELRHREADQFVGWLSTALQCGETFSWRRGQLSSFWTKPVEEVIRFVERYRLRTQFRPRTDYRAESILRENHQRASDVLRGIEDQMLALQDAADKLVRLLYGETA